MSIEKTLCIIFGVWIITGISIYALHLIILVQVRKAIQRAARKETQP